MSELVAPTQSEVPEVLRAGRASFARHAWREGCLAGTVASIVWTDKHSPRPLRIA
jgi:hypothetical protein